MKKFKHGKRKYLYTLLCYYTKLQKGSCNLGSSYVSEKDYIRGAGIDGTTVYSNLQTSREPD